MPKQFDIIVYGASGYTAKHIIPHLESVDCKLGLSGRNKKKFYKSNLPVIKCNVENIDEVTKQTRILVNCVGPYHRTAENIIKSCIQSKTHYIDFCGETGFMKQMIEKYDKQARQKNVFIVQACGFDSLPADVGVEYLKQQFDADIKIESTMELKNCTINVGTWATLIDSVANHKNPQKITSTSENPSLYIYNSELNAYSVKFMGSDGFVVRRSQDLSKKCNLKYASYKAYLKIGSLTNLILYYVYLTLIFFFCKFNLGQRLLVKYCSFFSNGLAQNNPPFEIVKKGSFTFYFTGVGVKDGENVEKKMRVDGPDPGYTTTGATVALCAETLLYMIRRRDKDEHITNVSGGILTPGFLFSGNEFVNKLRSIGINFQLK